MKQPTTQQHWNIQRGQLYFADFDPTVGSEQGGTRPSLVIQNDVGNRHSNTTIVAPITSKKKPELPTHLLLIKQPGIEEGSMLLLEQLRTVDKARLGKYIGELNPDLLYKVNGCLAISLGLFQRNSTPMVVTLCRECANHYRDTNMYFLQRINYHNPIKEPCNLCTRPGFDYAVTRR